MKKLHKDLDDHIDDLNKKGLDSRWFCEDRDTEQKESTKKVLLNSTIQFRLLKKILTDMFHEKKIKHDLDKQNVNYKILWHDGYRSALQDIYRLLP